MSKKANDIDADIKLLLEKLSEGFQSIEDPPELHSFAMKWFRKENEKEVFFMNVVVNSQ